MPVRISKNRVALENIPLNEALGANIASAATVNLTNTTGNTVHLTGTTTITAITLASGSERTVVFDGILTLTHHSTNNNLPGGVNITTAPNDRARYIADGTTVYCVNYQKADGTAVAVALPYNYILVEDVKSSGSSGQTLTGNIWNVRNVNTEVIDTGGHCSIASNQITLAAGTYECDIACGSVQGEQHQARLFNVTDNATTKLGTNATTRSFDGADFIQSYSFIKGRFTITAQKIFEIQHWVASDSVAGNSSGTGGEVYLSAEFRKVA